MGLIYVLHEQSLEYITNKVSPSSMYFLPHIGYACKHVLQRQVLLSIRKKCCWHGWLNWWPEEILSFSVDLFVECKVSFNLSYLSIKSVIRYKSHKILNVYSNSNIKMMEQRLFDGFGWRRMMSTCMTSDLVWWLPIYMA